MSTTFLDQTRTALADRRVQISAAATAFVLVLGGMAVAAADRGAPAGPDLADHAQLAVQLRPGPGAVTPAPVGKLATLDPEQMQATRVEPVDPALKAMIAQERREDAQAAAEQRAFDTRLRAQLNDSQPVVRYDDQNRPPEPTERPARQGGWTSNTEDRGDSAPA